MNDLLRMFVERLADMDENGHGREIMAEFDRMVAASLDAAWAEAEAALPEGWAIGAVTRNVEGHGRTHGQAWWCSAFRLRAGAPLLPDKAASRKSWDDPLRRQIAYGPTPAAALRALAAKLRERAG